LPEERKAPDAKNNEKQTLSKSQGNNRAVIQQKIIMARISADRCGKERKNHVERECGREG